MGETLLPDWMAKSKQHAEMEKESLAETRVGVSVALASLHMAMSQQMAIATILVKPDEPNYSLLGKLCLGVAVELESFVSTMRSKSAVHMARMESGFLTFVTFQINVQRALGMYFLSRSLWNASEYGVAIAALSEANVAMRTRTTPTGRGKRYYCLNTLHTFAIPTLMLFYPNQAYQKLRRRDHCKHYQQTCPT